MIENKLLHFNSRSAFESAKNNIADSSIAFIDEGRTIYTHGVEYKALKGDDTDLSQYVTYQYLSNILNGYQQASTITQTVQTILDAMQPSWTTIVDKIGNAVDSDDFEHALAEINAKIDGWEAQITLTALWEALTNGEKNQHVATIFAYANAQDSGITLKADHIDLVGDVYLRSYIEGIIADHQDGSYADLEAAVAELRQWQNSRGYLSNSGIVFQNNDTDNFVAFTSTTGTDPIGGLYHKHPSTGESSYRLGNDGSGYLGLIAGSNGQHAIWWDTNGTLHFHNSITSQWGGGGSSSTATGQFYDQAFTLTSTPVAPAVPSDANAHPWPMGADDDTRIENGYDTGTPSGPGNWARSVYDASAYGIQDDEPRYVWMTTRLYDIENGTPLEQTWNGPWLISGADGNPGEDGKGIEFVYTRTATNDASVVTSLTSSLQSTVANRDKTFQDDDFVPTGWDDNPSGVSAAYPFEWMGLRTSNNEGVWSDFSGPFLWSHYGQNGTDGDGVEYIFWASSNGTAPLQDPSTWSTSSTTPGKYDRIFQDNDYVGPTNSEWQDNPIDLKGVSYGPGSVQYVSMRKKNGSTGLWGAFSAPAFWSNYAVDGVVEGYVVDLSNEVMPIVVDDNGDLASAYTNTTEVSVFHNGLKETATVVAGTPVRSDGGSVTGITAAVTTSSIDADDKTVTVTVPTTITGIAGVNIYIPLTVTLQDTTTRNVVITCFGIAAGAGMPAFDLKTDVAAIRRNIAGTTVDPSRVRVYLNFGLDEYTAATASQFSQGTLTFEYAYDDGTYTTLSTEYIENIQANHNQLVVRAKLNGTPIDIERIPYIKDGEQGIPGTGSEVYTIVPKYSSIAVNEVGKLNGTVEFNVYRQIGLGEREEITTNPAYSRNIYVDVNGTNRSVSYSSGKWSTTVTNINYDSTKSASVYIYVKTTTDTLLWSLVIPIPIKGNTGSTGSSAPLKAFAFKKSTSQPATPTGGSYASPTPSGWSDGIPSSGTGAVWQTTTTFYPDNSNTGWSEPVVISSRFLTDTMYSTTDREDGVTLANKPGNPTTKPQYWGTYSSISNPEDIIWEATKTITDGVDSTWEVFRIKGEKGDPGPAGATELQGFEGVVMRIQPYNASMTYYDGTVAVDGVKYKDIVTTVVSNVVMYWELASGVHQATGIMPSTNTSGTWVPFNMVNAEYVNDLIVNNAYINSLTSKQVVITKKVNNKDMIVAGMVGGNSVPTEMIGESNDPATNAANGTYTSTNNSTGVRIFAGAVPNNGNIKNTAFTVTEQGTVKIAPTNNGSITFNSGNDAITTDDAKIIFNYDGSGQLAGGNIKWDKNGKFTFSQESGGFENQLTGRDDARNAIIPYSLEDHGNEGNLHIRAYFYKKGSLRSLEYFDVFNHDFEVLSKISDTTGYYYMSAPEAILTAVNLNKNSTSYGDNLFEEIGESKVTFCLPSLVNLATTPNPTEVKDTYLYFRSIVSNAHNVNFAPEGGSIVISDLPIVEILYSESVSQPSAPTPETIGMTGSVKTWNRYRSIENYKWCAYRYKDNGTWTNWTIEALNQQS